MSYEEDDYLMLSGIQHFEFCRRQWALIHIEQQWEENLRTVEGEIMHSKAHDENFTEKRRNVLITRGMPVFSSSLGTSGQCDIVEFVLVANDSGSGQRIDTTRIAGRDGVYVIEPIEYKRGSPKAGSEDVTQLIAQTICLEEMFCCKINKGYIFYGQTRRRLEVEVTDALRQKVRQDFYEMHQYYERQYTPMVKMTKSCNACSLKNVCLPKMFKQKTVAEYIANKMED